MPKIHGKFEVKMLPQAPDALTGEAVSRFLLEKRYHGELDASGAGQMLAIRGAVSGSAGYVAMERVTGTLAGRTGTFALQHRGVMTRGVAELLLTVVPDSGTGQLEGLSGSMGIEITGGEHVYGFEYALPD